MPPAHETSGCSTSTAPASSSRWMPQRVYSCSPPEIGTGLAARISAYAATWSGSTGSSIQRGRYGSSRRAIASV